MVTYIELYTPGNFAAATLLGSGFSQRSGFHSCASGPHVRVSRFAFKIEMIMPVLARRGIDWSCAGWSSDLDESEEERIGQSSGRDVSFRTLKKEWCLIHCMPSTILCVKPLTSSQQSEQEETPSTFHDKRHRGTEGSSMYRNPIHHCHFPLLLHVAVPSPVLR